MGRLYQLHKQSKLKKTTIEYLIYYRVRIICLKMVSFMFLYNIMQNSNSQIYIKHTIFNQVLFKYAGENFGWAKTISQEYASDDCQFAFLIILKSFHKIQDLQKNWLGIKNFLHRKITLETLYRVSIANEFFSDYTKLEYFQNYYVLKF